MINFLKLLYGEATGFVYLWTLPEKKTYCFSTKQLPIMAKKAQELSEQGNNVYFGVCGTNRKLGSHERPKQADISFIPGFWVDIDIQGEAHKSDNLPPDWTAARDLLPDNPRQTLLVASGYGLHAYWLFDSPWVLDSDEDRQHAFNASKAFQQTIKARAEAKGWKVDSTHDLSRILRLPGTYNYKLGKENAPPCYVTLITPERHPHPESPLSPGESSLMINNCKFIKYCRDEAKKISYDEWLAAGVNLIKAEDGKEVFHSISKLDPDRYTPELTDKKISEIQDNMKIITCKYIQETLGFAGCPDGGCRGVTSPADWVENPRVCNRVLAEPVVQPDTDLLIPPGFVVDANGIDYLKITPEGETIRYNACGNLVLIRRRFQCLDSQLVKVELEFMGQTLAVSQSTVLNSRQIITLADYGLSVSSETAKYLVKYFKGLLDCNKDKIQTIQTYSKMGWRDNEFILPDYGNNPVIDSAGNLKHMVDGLKPSGELGEWVQLMQPVRENPIGRFILSASFAAPLLHLLNCRNFIVHNWGDSRGGKTATLWAALSVWGNPEKLVSIFDTSIAALELRAEVFNDLPIGLDERETLNKSKKESLQTILYTLANGVSRGRATRNGDSRTVRRWRTVSITTGEDGLLDDSSQAGAFARVLEIGGGALANDKAHAQTLYAELPAHHGHAGRKFLDKLLTVNQDEIRKIYASCKKRLAEFGTDNLDSHIDIVAAVAIADYLSSCWIFGDLPHIAGEQSTETAKSILGSLVKVQETDPVLNAWEAFRGFLNQNVNRIHEDCVGERYGYYDYPNKVCIFRSVVNDFLKSRGQSDRKILKDWADRGFIESFKDGDRLRVDTRGRLFGGARSHVIVISQMD